MTVIATGVNKLLTYKRQTGQGIAVTAGSAQNLRRVTSTLDKKKATYASNEIRQSQQKSDFRHGVVSVDGSISGELSVGTYQNLIESLLRANATASVSIALSANDLVSASTGTNTGTLTVTAGNLMTGNLLKVGMVIRATGFTAPATANNSANLLITALTNKVASVARLDGTAVVAKTETAAVTLTEAGRHVVIPQSGHTRDYYTIEHNFQDIAVSEKFIDCVISQADIKLPASGMATVDFSVMGLDMVPYGAGQTAGAAPFFTSPTAVSNGPVLAAANGAVYLQGTPIALITGMNVSIKGGHSTIGGVVGSDIEPDIFPGSLDVTGQITVLFTDATARDMFLKELEVSLYCVFTGSKAANAEFVAISLPRVKMGGASKDDGEKGLVLTMPFTALENVAGGAGTSSHATTVAIQDSLFV